MHLHKMATTAAASKDGGEGGQGQVLIELNWPARRCSFRREGETKERGGRRDEEGRKQNETSCDTGVVSLLC